MAKHHFVALDLLDRYLLGEPVPKEQLVKRLLADASPSPVSAPFYRALQAVGTRAAEEAFIALRLALRGELPTDAAVRELRSLLALARSAKDAERETALAAYRKRVGGTV